ncbi:MAG: tripartite tricarboxylate transporter substrate-binding protein [Planctomycetia bacterium]|nr:tripartite tricarboxylate transporter substrate-binding protein [Planctomycetia bacterium]
MMNTFIFSVRQLKALALAAVSLVLTANADAQPAAYPAKPIKIVIAFAPGGIADSVGRLISQKLSDRLGQPVVVENHSGAAGNIGTRLVAKAEPDGHTLLVNTTSMAINVSLYKEAGYKISDFVPVAIAASTPNLFATTPSVKAANLRELAQLYKGKQLTYSTAGIGSSSHLTAHYVFNNLLGIDSLHVPFKGGAPAITAAVAAQVDLVSVSMPPAVPFINAGRLKGLALASVTRVAALPNVPTFAESGIPDLEDLSWVGVFAPMKTSSDIVERLNSEINAILRLNDVREKLQASGFEPVGGSTRDVTDYVGKEVAKWTRIVKATGVTVGD